MLARVARAVTGFEDVVLGAGSPAWPRIESLREVVLVAQGERVVEHWAREDDGSWRLTTWTGTARVPLRGIGCELVLDEVYAKVELLAPEPEPAAPRPKTLG